jgi:hypothetical protein
MPRGQSADDRELPKINLSTFVGGESIDLKNGIAGSVYTSLAMDFREKASQATVLPGLYNVATNTQLSDLITVMDQDVSGIRYGAGDLGYVYEIDASNVVTQLGQLDGNGGAGLVYNAQNDNLYISSQQSVSLFGQCTKMSPSLSVGHFGASASVAPGVIYIFNTTTSSYDGGTVSAVTTQRNNLNTLTIQGITPGNYAAQVTHPNTGTYTPLNAIAETAGNFTSFIPDIEPFYGVAVYVTTIGTGNLTLTMHDSLNNNLGAVTINHGSLTTGWNLFTFAAPGIRAFINAIASNTTSTGYHFHLTSSVNADTMVINTITNSDITGCNFVLFAYRLITTNNGWHPMVLFNQYLCVGNGNYLSTYNFGNDNNPNNAQWIRHQLLLDVGYEVTGVENAGRYLVITAARTSNSASRQYQGGYIYYWDGINASFNDRVPVQMGTPYSPKCINGVVYFLCNGSKFAYVPGSSTINKVRYIGYQNTNFLGTHDTTIVNPNMMTNRYNLLLVGYPSSTTNPKLNMGIYSWGAVELIYPNSFGWSYLPANGIETAAGNLDSDQTAYTNYQIGMIENFVDTLYMSSQYTDHNSVIQYRLDVLDNTSKVAPKFGMRCLMWDGGARYKEKKGLRVKVAFVALPTGTTITPYYSIDRGSDISQDQSGNSYTVNGDNIATQAFINVPAGTRSHELQWGFNGTTTNVTTPPVITGIAAEIDGLSEETDLRPDG